MNTVKTILFVENDPVALQMYSSRLEREGFHLDSASDGLEALKRISQLAPDLVVLDRMLPKLGGDDVLKFIRADPRLKNLPVVIFSNAPLTELAPEASGGSTKRLLKSDCTFPMLLQTVQELLRASQEGCAPAQAHSETAAAPLPADKRQAGASPVKDQQTGKERSQFLSDALAELPRIREHCFSYIKAPASSASLQHLPNLYQRVHFLSTSAGKAGYAGLAMLTKAFDTLLSEIMVKPSWVTPSVLQTIAQAVDGLGLLLKAEEADLAQPMPRAKVLAVDDDAVCNHVMISTLKRSNFDPRSVDDPLAALQLLEANQYDLVLLDINMPGLTGFELCEKLRRFPHCKTVPVVFITGHNNFDNRKQSVLSGGHDFITKPVSPSELALKATLHVLKAQMRRNAASPPGIVGAPDGASQDAIPVANAPSISPPRRPEPPSSVPSAHLLPVTESANSEAPVTSDPATPAESPTIQALTPGSPAATPVASRQPESCSVCVSVPAEAAQLPQVSVTTAAQTVRSPATVLSSNELSSAPEPCDQGPRNGRNGKFDRIATIVAGIMFGEDHLTEQNVRVVRAALEHYKVHEILEEDDG